MRVNKVNDGYVKSYLKTLKPHSRKVRTNTNSGTVQKQKLNGK